jgi:hypothetical protein
MTRAFWGTLLAAVGLAACGYRELPVNPPIWSVGYAVPFDAMVSCLSGTPAGPFTVSAPTVGRGGVVAIGVTSPGTPPGSARVVVYRLPEDGSQVNWWRPRDVNGLNALDGEVRSRANLCGNGQFRAM